MTPTKKKKLTIALTGNPNSGKTTLFNAITGARQHVGNWPGVTVEKKEGHTTYGDYNITVVDLPGTYSLTAYSIEEIIARKFIVHDEPDVVVHIIDAGNLERNLLLTTQILELECKLVLALNMFDAVEEKGATIDVKLLGSLVGAPAIPTIGTKEEGVKELLDAVIEVHEERNPLSRLTKIKYGHEIEDHILALQKKMKGMTLFDKPHPDRWTALKLLEKDEEVITQLAKSPNNNALVEEASQIREHLFSIFKDDAETIITERRYGFVNGIMKTAYTSPPIDRITYSDRVDSLLTHKILGLPVFFMMIWLMFQLTFTVGAYPSAWIEHGVAALADVVSQFLGKGMLRGLLVDGIINGVGSVLVFMPNIFILFLCISIFEDSGYMARAAFLTDRVMHLLGLHGKAFIPMLMGFGCNVPAIMATRTLESERDRILAILINPLVSCSARLPVYILLAGAFFPPNRAGTMIFAIYFLGLALAILMGRLFSKTILPGEAAPFVMELPPYRMPTMKSSLIHMWDRGKIFLRKMGGVILVGAVVIWVLGAFPRIADYSKNYDVIIFALQESAKQSTDLHKYDGRIEKLKIEKESERLRSSYIGRIGQVIEPVLRPLGLTWKEGVALTTGFVAKEIVVSTLGVLYQADESGGEKSDRLKQSLRSSGLTPLSAFAFMAFILIYTPCLGTVAAIRRETNSWKWTAFSVGYTLFLAWIVAFIIIHLGRLFGFE